MLGRSKFAAMLWGLKDWAWAQAMVVGGVNILLPTFCLLDWARQCLRRSKSDTSSLTPLGMKARESIEVRESTRKGLGDTPKRGWCGVLLTLVSCCPRSFV